ncbi:MAG: hypothetical protein QXU40_00705 [Candidatus Pacearchaeota archaeon]
MKPILSKEEKRKREKKNQIILGVILVFIMVVSTVGFVIEIAQDNIGKNEDGNVRKIKYNKTEFVYTNGLWLANNLAFRYSPLEVPRIEGAVKSAESYRGYPLYIYSENEDAEMEIRINLGRIVERIQFACLEDADFKCEGGLPVKTCEENFLVIRNSTEAGIKEENNCVYITGPYEELPKITDAFLFKTFGIIG